MVVGGKKNNHVIIALNFRCHKHQTRSKNKFPGVSFVKYKASLETKNNMTKSICFRKITPLLTSYFSFFTLASSTDKQNYSSGLEAAGNVPSTSKAIPDFPQLHTWAQPTPSAHEFVPAVAKATSTGQNMECFERARCALKQANHPRGKPMVWAVLCLSISVWRGQLQW